MNDKRRIQIPIFPYILFVLSLVTIFATALIYVNYPSQIRIVWGTLASGGILMLLSIIMRPAIFKEVFASKKTMLWINDIFLVMAIIGIGVLLSYIGFRRNYRYDFTKTKLFSISDQTIKTLRNLTKSVKVTAFYPQGAVEEEMIKNLLNEYKRQTDKFSFSLIDPRRDPISTKAMNISSIGTVVIQCGTNRKDISASRIFVNPNPRTNPDGKPKFKGEQIITSAIINVVNGKKPIIKFVTGHEEASITGFKGEDIAGLNELLTKENYSVSKLNLMTDSIGSNTSVLAIISPRRDFADAEISKLQTFVKKQNGHLLVTLDPMNDTQKLEDFLTHEFGVMANNDVVVDPRGYQQRYWTVLPTYENHPIIAPLKARSLASLMFYCRSLTTEKRPLYKQNIFLKTIAKAWAKRHIDPKVGPKVAFDKTKDALGPLNLAVAVESKKNASGTKLVIFGDSDFATNSYITIGGNKDLFLNTINWLAGQEKLISIRAKVVDIPRIVMNGSSTNRIFTLCVIVFPLIIILFGAFVFYTRRRVSA